MEYLRNVKKDLRRNYNISKCDIIIPIYNAYDALVECTESVLKNTDLKDNGLILIDDCSTDSRIKEYLKESTRIHYRLVKIQPFEGANGRTARAVLNVLLIQKGMMGIFRKENRGEYIEYINEANRIINENEKQYLQGLCGNVEECNCYENEFLKNEFPALFVRI